MAKYLTRLWDDYSKIVLSNARDFDTRDDAYAEEVSSKVWDTVDKLRTKRSTFFKLIRAELGRQKKSSKPPAP